MKVALADSLSPTADAAFALAHPSLADAWLGAAAYTLQLYFDFAGYSLMAIGLARMIGFHFPSNFDQPYLAASIQDFWQRWHITLSRFLRDYLYIPLGGNRRGPLRTYVNLLQVMAIGGLWHGASWTFVVWGLWHGGLLGAHRMWTRAGTAKGPAGAGSPKPTRAMPYPLANALTMLAVVIGWVIFRAPDMGTALAFYRGMAGLNGTALSDALAWQVTPDRLLAVPIAAAVVYLPLLRLRLRALRSRPAAAASAASAASMPALALISARPSGRPGAALPAVLYVAPRVDTGAARGVPPRISLVASLPSALRNALRVAAAPAAFALAVVLLYSRDAVPFLYFQF